MLFDYLNPYKEQNFCAMFLMTTKLKQNSYPLKVNILIYNQMHQARGRINKTR